VRRSKTQTKIYRDTTISSTTTRNDTNKRRRGRVIKNNKMPTIPTMCPQLYHASRNAQLTWIFERGGKRLLDSRDEDPHTQSGGPISMYASLRANVENLYSIMKRAVARMFGR
jgi:hypothetical protein